MLMIHFVEESSTFVAESASEMALKETSSKAPSMSRKTSRTYPFLAIFRSILLETLCRAAQAELPLVQVSGDDVMLRSCCLCHSSTVSSSLSNTGRTE